LKLLRAEHLTELFVPGFTDDGGGRISSDTLPNAAVVFHPMPDDVYLKFGRQLVHLRSIDQYSRMSATFAEKIECSFEIDPDDTFGVVPVFDYVLESARDSARVSRLDAFLGEGCDPDECMFVALGMACDSGDYLFFDPLDYEGIHIGSIRKRQSWESYWGRHPNFTYTVRSYDMG